ncbi:hypothetical protein CHS0354_027058 [Potamilus streckersoni]|uniref:BTB domain-containing protein n=1 Tax=Potamilus streckersoni TaxID=2493646 RepID=A0AAE0VGQ5_9BIVA|nr:hypothetical protein CHS0354_027058 [Potamilus streckersoni]
METLSDLFRKSKLTDITIVVGEKELHFSKYPLMEASAVLTELIEESEDQSRLQLTDVEYDDLVLFLACLHPKQLLSITDENLERVATLADHFEHVGVLKKCEEYIVQQFEMKRDNKDGMYPCFFFHLRIAECCGLSEAVQIGMSSKKVQMAYYSSKSLGPSSQLKGYKGSDDFEELSLETKFEILRIRLEKAEEMINPKFPY